MAQKSYVLITSKLFTISSRQGARSTDPIIRRQQLDAEKLRRRTDEEWHKKELAIKRQSWHRLHSNDPEWSERANKWSKERYDTDPMYKLSQQLKQWLRKHTWVREELPWRTHRPVLHASPVQHRCEVCGLLRLSGLLMVWQSITQPSSYRCNKCYIQQGPEVYMPEGYEDVRNFKDVVARKKQLERLMAYEAKAPSTADGERSV